MEDHRTCRWLQLKLREYDQHHREAYYYITIPLMVIIHAGFLAYEMGASRAKNALSSGVKNILAFAFVIPAFYFFGWWVYWAMPTGFSLSAGPNGISGAEYACAIALAWGESAAYMGPNLADQIDGVFWGAFTLFAATTASMFGCCNRAHSNGWVGSSHYLRWIQLDTAAPWAGMPMGGITAGVYMILELQLGSCCRHSLPGVDQPGPRIGKFIPMVQRMTFGTQLAVQTA